jgi:hypothetical protein
MIKKGEKGGQVTIFIIIAILIVALGILIYLYYPKIFANVSPETTSPSLYIQQCMEEKIQDTVTNLSLQGGSVNPPFYYTYYNGEGVNKIEYLCYINQYYRSCVVQRPMLLEHIKSEILKEIKNSTVNCFNLMEKSYQNKGYETNMTPGNTTVEILSGKIVTTFAYELDLTKGETAKYKDFRIVLDNDLYLLVGVTNSIINWEAQYGEAEVTTYMNYYHDLKVEKKKQVDETVIYILTDTKRDNKFEFAIRSYAFPPGIAP